MIKNCFRITFALLSFIVTMFIIASPALSGTVFGPKQYTRTTGSPDVYTDTFQTAGGNGILMIQNGTPDGGNRITSGEIQLNGIKIFGSDDFKKKVYAMEKPVQLNNMTNTLHVELESKPGSYITAAVTKPVAIDIMITSPLDGGSITGTRTAVTGTIDNLNGRETGVTVNGILASMTGGQFVASNIPLNAGPNAIAVIATDTEGTQATKTIIVNATIPEEHIRIEAYPSSGTAPRRIAFVVSSSWSNSILHYQMDFDGNGTADDSGDKLGNLHYTYPSEGIYHPRITITDSAGNGHSAETIVVVQSKTQLEDLLRGKWDQMKTELMTGNVETALNHFLPGNREKYRAIFTNLGPDKIRSIFSGIGAIHLSDQYEKVASGGVLRQETGGTYSYPVTFIQDANGIWRIFEF